MYRVGWWWGRRCTGRPNQSDVEFRPSAPIDIIRYYSERLRTHRVCESYSATTVCPRFAAVSAVTVSRRAFSSAAACRIRIPERQRLSAPQNFVPFRVLCFLLTLTDTYTRHSSERAPLRQPQPCRLLPKQATPRRTSRYGKSRSSSSASNRREETVPP